MRFFDKQAKLEAKITAQAEAMTKKVDVAGTLSSTWQNEAASYQTTSPVSNQGFVTEARTWVANTAFEQPEMADRPKRGRRSMQPDGPPVRQGPDRRPVYRPNRVFGIGGIFSANRPDAGGRVDRERWPSETGGSRNQSRSGRDGCPGCPYC